MGGDKTCHGGWSPGSYGFYEKDAQTFADWEVDYVKIDYCGNHTSVEGHVNMSKALNATGRPMGYMLCRGPYSQEDHWGYAPEIAQGWRATGDHHDNFDSTKEQVIALAVTNQHHPPKRCGCAISLMVTRQWQSPI